jgi:hypothetical protein
MAAKRSNKAKSKSKLKQVPPKERGFRGNNDGTAVPGVPGVTASATLAGEDLEKIETPHPAKPLPSVADRLPMAHKVLRSIVLS